MGEAIYPQYSQDQKFRIDYPYYGLFGSADIKPLKESNELIFECKLLNGTILYLKKLMQQQKWIDMSQNNETALSSIIGNSIDDFLKSFLNRKGT